MIHARTGLPLDRRQDNPRARNMLLRRAAIRDDRLESTAIRPGDSHDNAVPHKESLNCFGHSEIVRINQTD